MTAAVVGRAVVPPILARHGARGRTRRLSWFSLLDNLLFLDDPNGTLLRPDGPPMLLRPLLGELGTEQQDHRGVVDPDEQHGECPGGTERVAGIAPSDVLTDEKLSNHEEQ